MEHVGLAKQLLGWRKMELNFFYLPNFIYARV